MNTDLDRYLIKQFSSLKQAPVDTPTSGQGFLKQITANYFKIMPYPSYNLTDYPLFAFSKDVPSSNIPVYYKITGMKKKYQKKDYPKLYYDFVENDVRNFIYLIEIKSYEKLPLEDELNKIFHIRFNNGIYKEKTPFVGANYQILKSLILNELEGYNKIYDYHVEPELLDGLEIEGIQDLIPLSVISSSPLSFANMTHAGGYHIGLLGKNTSTLENRIRRLSLNRLLVQLKKWNIYSPKVRHYRKWYMSRSTDIFQEYDVLLKHRITKKNTLFYPIDYPINISNAPKAKDDKITFNLQYEADIQNYLTYVHFLDPELPGNTDQVLTETSHKIIKYIEKEKIPPMLMGEGKFFDPNYYGKPETLIRMAISMGRINNSDVSDRHLSVANDFLTYALDDVISGFQDNPKYYSSIYGLEKDLYGTMLELQESYPEGIPFSTIEADVKYDLSTLKDILTNLKQNGACFEPNNGVYLPIPQ
ncbi:MAG: hypothetical protein HeimC3_34250 [Candidatus Heimdallarchaeota archaeon LC_3]|nr:MAG: hypothetical protein HeimC3_34250 [Candidatus Heimdallarchaeota archaeon LC_3]